MINDERDIGTVDNARRRQQHQRNHFYIFPFGCGRPSTLVTIMFPSVAFSTQVTVASFFERSRVGGHHQHGRRPTQSCAQTGVATPAPRAMGMTLEAAPYFGRVATAMVTPFKLGTEEIDYAVAEQLAAHLVANGSDSLVIGGTTGESPTLTWSEQYELFSVVRNAVNGKAKVIAGAGSNSTEEAVEATHRAAKMGLHGTLQVVPYYNKPPQEGMYLHFKKIAEAEPDLPVMLYNIPGRTGVNMSPEVTIRLSALDNVIACKQASNDLEELVQIRKGTNPNFHLYAGDDCMTLPFLSLGASGVVSIASHFVGNEIQSMVTHFLAGRVAEARDIHMQYERLFSELFCMVNPIPTKTALRLQGWAVGGPRLPLVDATPEVEKKLLDLLTALDLL
jgi:4-hydroxy-tetrahydrodipicolinate synthase